MIFFYIIFLLNLFLENSNCSLIQKSAPQEKLNYLPVLQGSSFSIGGLATTNLNLKNLDISNSKKTEDNKPSENTEKKETSENKFIKFLKEKLNQENTLNEIKKFFLDKKNWINAKNFEPTEDLFLELKNLFEKEPEQLTTISNNKIFFNYLDELFFSSFGKLNDENFIKFIGELSIFLGENKEYGKDFLDLLNKENKLDYKENVFLNYLSYLFSKKYFEKIYPLSKYKNKKKEELNNPKIQEEIKNSKFKYPEKLENLENNLKEFINEDKENKILNKLKENGEYNDYYDLFFKYLLNIAKDNFPEDKKSIKKKDKIKVEKKEIKKTKPSNKEEIETEKEISEKIKNEETKLKKKFINSKNYKKNKNNIDDKLNEFEEKISKQKVWDLIENLSEKFENFKKSLNQKKFEPFNPIFSILENIKKEFTKLTDFIYKDFIDNDEEYLENINYENFKNNPLNEIYKLSFNEISEKINKLKSNNEKNILKNNEDLKKIEEFLKENKSENPQFMAYIINLSSNILKDGKAMLKPLYKLESLFNEVVSLKEPIEKMLSTSNNLQRVVRYGTPQQGDK